MHIVCLDSELGFGLAKSEWSDLDTARGPYGIDVEVVSSCWSDDHGSWYVFVIDKSNVLGGTSMKQQATHSSKVTGTFVSEAKSLNSV